MKNEILIKEGLRLSIWASWLVDASFIFKMWDQFASYKRWLYTKAYKMARKAG